MIASISDHFTSSLLWVWSVWQWNITINRCRPTHSTVRKSQRTLTITWQADKLSKITTTQLSPSILEMENEHFKDEHECWLIYYHMIFKYLYNRIMVWKWSDLSSDLALCTQPLCTQDQTLLWTCVANAHFQCVNSRYAMLNIQEWNNVTPKSNNVIYSMWRNKYRMYTFNVLTIIIQSVNITKWKLLELQITQTRHPEHFGWKTCLSSTALNSLHKKGEAQIQCMNNHYICNVWILWRNENFWSYKLHKPETI